MASEQRLAIVEPYDNDRFVLFANSFHALINKREMSLIVFEDIHWADEATLDFIKFFCRRIGQLRCLFLLKLYQEKALTISQNKGETEEMETASAFLPDFGGLQETRMRRKNAAGRQAKFTVRTFFESKRNGLQY